MSQYSFAVCGEDFEDLVGGLGPDLILCQHHADSKRQCTPAQSARKSPVLKRMIAGTDPLTYSGAGLRLGPHVAARLMLTSQRMPLNNVMDCCFA